MSEEFYHIEDISVQIKFLEINQHFIIKRNKDYDNLHFYLIAMYRIEKFEKLKNVGDNLNFQDFIFYVHTCF